ncbi:MAG: hypothetical protein U0169_24710 [Polyangiaceae bacterium]
MEGLRARCRAVGFDPDAARGSLVDRMRLLAEVSHTFDDASRMADHAERVFRHVDATRPSKPFDAVERQTVVLGCLFSDIGKTGPEGADVGTRRIVAEAFAVENVKDDRQSFATFVRASFPADAEPRLARLAAIGVPPSITLRQFWNLHTGWTLAIAEAAGLPAEAVGAAAAHHLLEDVNPESIVGEDDRFTRPFGRNATFDRAEKLVILLDKYDASMRRGGRSHEDAILWLRDRLASSARFFDDEEFVGLLRDVEVALAPT